MSKIEKFILKAIVVHGNRYDYSMITEFVNVHTPVPIICEIHGEFNQRPVKHTSQGCGCPECGRVIVNNSRRSNKDQFITKAQIKHGNKYNYDAVVYINNHTPVTIVCPIHGEFKQLPVKHTSQGCGCPQCCNEFLNNGRYCNTLFDRDRELAMSSGYIYVIFVEGLTKVGITKNSASERHYASTNVLLEMKHNLERSYQVEQEMLDMFYKQRTYPTFEHRGGGTEYLKLSTRQIETLLLEIQDRINQELD